MLCHQSQSHPSISGLFSHRQWILVICFSLCDTKNSTWSVPGASQITCAACLCFYLSVLGCYVKILPSTPSFSALSSHRHLILVICFVCVAWRIVIWSVPDAPPTSTDLNHEKKYPKKLKVHPKPDVHLRPSQNNGDLELPTVSTQQFSKDWLLGFWLNLNNNPCKRP